MARLRGLRGWLLLVGVLATLGGVGLIIWAAVVKGSDSGDKVASMVGAVAGLVGVLLSLCSQLFPSSMAKPGGDEERVHNVVSGSAGTVVQAHTIEGAVTLDSSARPPADPEDSAEH